MADGVFTAAVSVTSAVGGIGARLLASSVRLAADSHPSGGEAQRIRVYHPYFHRQ